MEPPTNHKSVKNGIPNRVVSPGDWYNAIQIHQDLVIGPRTLEEVSDSDFINHSCDPNCGVNGQIALVAMRDIDAGEEINFDYAMVITGSHEYYPLECLCGSDNCREVITSNDWMIGDLRHRYDGFFSDYIIKMFEKETLPIGGQARRTK